MDGLFTPPPPQNEPVKGYAPGSPERKSLEQVLTAMAGACTVVAIGLGLGGDAGHRRRVVGGADQQR